MTLGPALLLGPCDLGQVLPRSLGRLNSWTQTIRFSPSGIQDLETESGEGDTSMAGLRRWAVNPARCPLPRPTLASPVLTNASLTL